MSEHQVSVDTVKRNPGEHSVAEMISELMGLVVAVGLMFGAGIGAMVNLIGSGGNFEVGSAVIIATLTGASIGTLVAFLSVRLAEKWAEKSDR